MTATSSTDEKYAARYPRPKIAKVLEAYADHVTGIDPACVSVAQIGARDFDSLVDSVRSRGLLTPILLDAAGKLIDGRCRLMALHTLGLPLTDDLISHTEVDPEAIAESNVARRHLTLGQKIMRASALVVEERAASSERRRKGAAKGRENRKNPLATETVTSNVKKKRAPSSVDKVSKLEGVSRANLKAADAIKARHPELAAKLERGEVSWSDAKDRTKHDPAIAKRPGKTTCRSKTSKQQASGKRVGKTFVDDRTSITDRKDGIRVVDCGDVIVFHHVDVVQSAMAYRGKNEWWLGEPDAEEHTDVETRHEVIKRAIALMKSRVAESGD